MIVFDAKHPDFLSFFAQSAGRGAFWAVDRHITLLRALFRFFHLICRCCRGRRKKYSPLLLKRKRDKPGLLTSYGSPPILAKHSWSRGRSGKTYAVLTMRRPAANDGGSRWENGWPVLANSTSLACPIMELKNEDFFRDRDVGVFCLWRLGLLPKTE